MFSENDRKTITGYLEKYRAEKAFPGSERTIFHGPDCRYDRFSNPTRLRLRFGSSLHAIPENTILPQVIIKEFLKNDDSGIDFDDTDIDIKEREKNP